MHAGGLDATLQTIRSRITTYRGDKRFNEQAGARTTPSRSIGSTISGIVSCCTSPAV